MAACGLLLASVSCRKGGGGDAENSGPPPVIARELRGNRLDFFPGAVYRSQAESPIHWQPWTKDSLDRARDARRLVFCVIAMPQQPGFQKVLAALESDSSVVRQINEGYVPVLIDADASREIGILSSDLCIEIRRRVNLPLFLWMTYEGNPVAWIPLTSAEPSTVLDLFGQAHPMVSQMWRDVSDYVIKNSRRDNDNRRARIERRKLTRVTSEQPGRDVVRSLRQLASLYDPYTRSFDEAGGLIPASALEALAAAALHPGLPQDVRSRCLSATRDLLKDLLPSAMFDPLDGGVFSSRRASTWALPSFVRDCPTQSRVAVALIEAHRATGDRRALEKALGLIGFAEKAYATPEGLFAVGMTWESDPELWMWKVEEIEKSLAPEDAKWWIQATGMKGLGNLPSEADPRREFFRSNTLGLAKTVEELSAELSLPPDVFAPRLEAVKSKLLGIRKSRFGKSPRDVCPHAGATFRMVSAYAAAFAATGDEAHRQKAITLLKRAREAFGAGPRLRLFATDAPQSIGAARAFIYALAMQAVLDVAAITRDEQWLVWAEDLATTSAELFTGEGFIKECPDEARLIDLPVTDVVMLFDDSTAGLVSMAECRLAELGRPLVPSFSELATPMPTYMLDRPVLHTDLLLATLARHYKVTVVCGAEMQPALRHAVERLPVRMVQRRPARPEDQVPDGSVKVVFGSGGDGLVVATPEALREAVLP